MCTRLGKKHHQYVGTEGLQKLKKDRTHPNPKRRLIDTYRVRLLLEHTYLRDVFWNPQNDNLKGIGKPPLSSQDVSLHQAREILRPYR